MKVRTEKPRILIDISVVADGGSETYATGFLDALARRGPDPTLTVLLPAAPALAEQAARLRSVGVDLIRAGHSEPGAWRSRVRAQLRLPMLVIRRRPAVVFVPREIVPILTPARMVLLAHNRLAWEAPPAGTTRGGRLSFELRRLSAIVSAARANLVITTTDALRGALPVIAKRKARTIHQGCDLPAVPVESKKAGCLHDGKSLRVAAIGAMSPHKRFDTVIKTVAELRRRGVDVTLDLWGPPGTPDQSEYLISLSAELLGENPLRGRYSRADRRSIYESIDLLMMGSSFESFGHPMAEALRTSCAVVAPASCLVGELCGDVAITYRESDPVDAADSILAALPDLAEIAARGLARSLDFSWDRCAASTLALIEYSARRSGRPRLGPCDSGPGHG